jgi:hypothetical protein
MPNALVAQDMIVTVKSGGARDGTPDFTGAVATALTCYVEDFQETERDREIDQTGPCDLFEILRAIGKSHEFEIEIKQPTTGPVFRALKDSYIRLEFQQLSTGTTYSMDCVMPERQFRYSNNSNQTERARLRRYA